MLNQEEQLVNAATVRLRKIPWYVTSLGIQLKKLSKQYYISLTIAKRIGQETPSDYHDGFDTSWYHYKCCNKKFGAPSFSKLSDLRDWETLRWDDQIKIKKDLGEEIQDNEEERRREKARNPFAFCNVTNRLQGKPCYMGSYRSDGWRSEGTSIEDSVGG